MSALDIGLRASLVVLVALIATVVLRRRSAALRHWVLVTGILSAAAVAPLGVALPAWDLPASPASAESARTSFVSVEMPEQAVSATSVPSAPAAAPAPAWPLVAVINAVWVLGAVASVLFMLVSLRRLARLSAAAQPVSDPRWLAAAQVLAANFSLGHVELLQTDRPTTLGTWGWRRPRVLLPSQCDSWSDDRIHIVLGHELAHIRRGDWPLQMAADLVRAVFWYNPLFWVACARLRRESEEACDNAVLEAGVPAADYASHLLEIARTCRPPSPLATLVPMARRSTLEWRIAAMLNHTLARTRPTRRTLAFAFAVIAGITLTTASFRANEQVGPMPLTGTVYDVTGAVLPAVSLTLDDATGVRLTATTDRNGRFDFGSVAAGHYQVGSKLPGFMSLAQDVRLENARQWDLSLTIPVGTIQERITVTDQRPANIPARSDMAPVRIGGNIKPPRKLVDVRPIYPQAMRDAGLEGVVSLTALIDIQGRVTSVQVIGSPAHPDLGQAAADAVRQWQFSPTLLNGQAVEVLMNVQVGFSLQD